VEIGEPLGYGDFEHLQCTLELLSSLVTGLKSDFEKATLSKTCTQMVYYCASQLPDLDVIEVAIGILGDLSLFCPRLFQGSEPELFSLFLRVGQDIDSARIQSGACRNSVWAFGELATSLPGFMNQNPRVVEEGLRMVGALMMYREEKAEWSFDTADVAAASAGILAKLSLELFQQSFFNFGTNNSQPMMLYKSWTKILFKMGESYPSRTKAIEGWAMFTLRRPDVSVSILPIVYCTILSFDFRQEDPQLHHILTKLLNELRSIYGSSQAEWKKLSSMLKPELAQALRDVYGLQ